MSLDTQKFVMLIKQAAVEAVNAKDPMSFKIGEVVSVSPLKISLNQKITIPSSQLLLTDAVRDHTVYATVDLSIGSALDDVDLSHKHDYNIPVLGEDGYTDATENAGDISLGHIHTCKCPTKFTVRSGLKVGEKVILLRCDGGQKFIVLDRLEAQNG